MSLLNETEIRMRARPSRLLAKVALLAGLALALAPAQALYACITGGNCHAGLVSEFGLTSHHVISGLAQSDCEVCHDETNHNNSHPVRLIDADSGAIYTESSSGAFQPGSMTATDISNLTAFCASCHDEDGATRLASPFNPFGDDGRPVAVSTHGNTHTDDPLEGPFVNGCAQCHTGHGSTNLALINSTIVVTPTVTTGPVVFTAYTGADSFDESDSTDTDDLCATCHTHASNPGTPMTSHTGGDHGSGDDWRGTNCTVCHSHDPDYDAGTVDGFTSNDDPLVYTIGAPIYASTPYDFGNGICGSLIFTDTGSGMTSVIITYTQDFPSTDSNGLPRQYKITTNGSGFAGVLTLCYDDDELAIAGIGNETQLRAYRHTSGGIWEALPTQAVDTGNNTITVYGVEHFSAWGIGAANSGEYPTALWIHSLAAQNRLWLSLGIAGLLCAGLVLYKRRS